MKLKELKNQTNDLTNFEMFKTIECEFNAMIVKALPEEWKTYLFTKKAKKIHGDKYDYSKVEYKHSCEEVTIICNEHGSFEQTPTVHINNHGCHECGINSIKTKSTLTTLEFIKNSKNIHDDKYDYSKVKYVRNDEKVIIICPIHREFKQTPTNHQQTRGCPRCGESKGEKAIAKFLDKHNIEYIREYQFKELGHLRFDFYLSKLNTVIEFDGIQHFIPIGMWKGVDGFKKRQKNDKAKDMFCSSSEVRLIRIKYTDYNNVDKILKDLL